MSPRELWYAIETDRWFRVPATRLAERHAAHQPATYAYLFTWRSPALGGMLGSCHALEIPFVFGTLRQRVLEAPRSVAIPSARRVSAHMQKAWLAFARTGDPANSSLPRWPRYHDAKALDHGLRPGVRDRGLAALRTCAQFWDETDQESVIP